MKKNVLTKVLLALLVVLLALSVVACKPKPSNNGGNDNGGDDDPVNENIAQMEDVGTIIRGLKPLAQKIDAIDDEIHADFALEIQYNTMIFVVKVQANIYGSNAANNEALLEITERDTNKSSEPAKMILGVYLEDNVIYLNQGFTASNNTAKFSNLDGFELSNKLSELPGFIKDLKLDLATTVDSLAESIAKMGAMANGVLTRTEALEFFSTDNEYKLAIVSEKLGALVSSLIDLVAADGFGDLQGMIDFVSQIIFGTDLENIENATSFPELSIIAAKNGENSVNGIEINYKGELDENNAGKETVRFKVSAEIEDSIDVDYPNNWNTYAEGGLKASLNIDLGMKGLRLAGDIYANPDFRDDGTNTPKAYLSDMKVYQGETEIAEINAEYNGETLYFDLGALYDLLGATKPEITVYGVDFSFFGEGDDGDDDNDDGDDDSEGSDDTGSSTDEGSGLPFALSPNWLTTIVGKIPSILDLAKESIEQGSLSIDTDYILNTLLEGLIVKSSDKTKAYDKATMIADIEKALAPFAIGYEKAEADNYTDEDIADFASSVIFDITGVQATVASIINATGDDSVQITLGLIEDALGISLNLAKGDDEFLDFSIELDIIDVENDFDYPTPSNFADFVAGEDYIDLNSIDDPEDPNDVFNIYYVTEGEGDDAKEVKKYVILDELLDLLDAYKAYGQHK